MAVRLGFSPAAKLQMRSIAIVIMAVWLGNGPAAKLQMRSIAIVIMAVWLGFGQSIAEGASPLRTNNP